MILKMTQMNSGWFGSEGDTDLPFNGKSRFVFIFHNIPRFFAISSNSLFSKDLFILYLSIDLIK